MRPPVGSCELPVKVHLLEGHATVSGYTNAEAGKASGLRLGDVIETIDGVPVTKLLDSWRPYYAASNEPTRLRDMTRGYCQLAEPGRRVVEFQVKLLLVG